MESIGSTLNQRYLLKEKIAEGGFAKIYLATDVLLRRQVAVKVLDQHMARDSDILKRFRTEAQAVAMLEHPNILPVYDYGESGGAPYLVMPFIAGGTLGARMKQGPLTLDEIGVYLDQIGSALDYAHGQGIVHRDVKPNNLLIRSDGRLVLMDFGLAKVLEQSYVAADTGIFGTVAYMAPEQFQGTVSPLSDIYMLGVILYQMLAGKLPFEGNTSQILLAHLQLVPAALGNSPTTRSAHPAVVRALDQVISKVLSKQPNQRYTTCQALSNAYYKALKADPVASAGNYRSEDRPNILDLSGTLIDKKGALPQTLPGANDVDGTLIEPASSPRIKALRKPARLIVTTEPDQGFNKSFELVGESITVGRSRENQILLPLDIISRYHAVCTRLDSLGRSYKIVQLKTTNPLRFNGKEISEKVLEHGDILEIGRRGYSKYIVKLMYQAAEFG